MTLHIHQRIKILFYIYEDFLLVWIDIEQPIVFLVLDLKYLSQVLDKFLIGKTFVGRQLVYLFALSFEFYFNSFCTSLSALHYLNLILVIIINRVFTGKLFLCIDLIDKLVNFSKFVLIVNLSFNIT